MCPYECLAWNRIKSHGLILPHLCLLTIKKLFLTLGKKYQKFREENFFGEVMITRLPIFFCVCLTGILLFHCSEDVEPTPLENILYGTYNNMGADYQPDSTSNNVLDSSPSDSTYLVLSRNKTFIMSVNLCVDSPDTLISMRQSGNFTVKNTRYIESTGNLTPSYWIGQIEFVPENSPNWGGEFVMYPEPPFALRFNELVFISIPESEGRILVYSWVR